MDNAAMSAKTWMSRRLGEIRNGICHCKIAGAQALEVQLALSRGGDFSVYRLSVGRGSLVIEG
jgi:hypothetical protein